MKKLNKLAAVAAVALGLGVIPQVHAIGYSPVEMELESGGRGDALLFPMFYGYTENYFTISNSTDRFIQGHLRFRGAAWSGELLDFDVILTPGDVFVFRLADIDGDGYWEIDQSLDPNNFAYTGMLKSCSPEGGSGVGKSQCIDQYSTLIPSTRCVSADQIVHHRNMGYVEFIGEGVLNEMTKEHLLKLIKSDNAGKFANEGQREIGDLLGTSLWSWVMPANVNDDRGWILKGKVPTDGIRNFLFSVGGDIIEDTADDEIAVVNARRTASDVPNALSGTAFITPVGRSHGLAYNAEAIVNFRTGGFPHRIDNYAVDTGVILHHENAAASPSTHAYVYGYGETGGWYNNAFESRISFNNTWGPTLADGDDYFAADVSTNLDRLRVSDANGSDDSFDDELGFAVPNSLAEVEEAIRKSTFYPLPIVATNADGTKGTEPDPSSPRQLFTGFYFDGATFDKACQGNGREGNPSCSNSTLQSFYAAFFPTKFFYAEDANLWNRPEINKCDGSNPINKLMGDQGYLEAAVIHSLNIAKPFKVQVWDITEKSPGVECTHSPCITPEATIPINQELAVFNIRTLKERFTSTNEHYSWDAGRVVLQVEPSANICRNLAPQGPACINTFPGLLYTFEIGSDGNFSHWRALER